MLESIEEWIDLTVTREADGSLTATGHLADEPGTGSRLRFRIGGGCSGWTTRPSTRRVDACASAVALCAVPTSA